MIKLNSIEWLINAFLSVTNLLILLLSLWCLLLAGFSPLVLCTVSILIVPIQLVLSMWFKNKLISPFYSISSTLESMIANDYASQLPTVFHSGIVKRTFDELAQFSALLRKKKRFFDEKNLLMYSLIKQLDSPIIIIDDELRLIHANQAFSNWLGKDWRLFRLKKINTLGLVNSSAGWQIETDEFTQYKVRSSAFKDEIGHHQLLLFTDISAELRDMQSKSWQQIVKVLSHEIKNSLTPIRSLSQSLYEISQDETQKEVLNLITERSEKLTDFVACYSHINKRYDIQLEDIQLQNMLASITVMYSEVEFVIELSCCTLKADPVLLEQVFINVLTNACQSISLHSEKGRITIKCVQQSNRVKLTFEDNGVGIQNSEHLFVPFYSTKPDGQGIGLLLAKQIIEQHGGHLTLANNTNKQGATACIYIPVQ